MPSRIPPGEYLQRQHEASQAKRDRAILNVEREYDEATLALVALLIRAAPGEEVTPAIAERWRSIIRGWSVDLRDRLARTIREGSRAAQDRAAGDLLAQLSRFEPDTALTAAAEARMGRDPPAVDDEADRTAETLALALLALFLRRIKPAPLDPRTVVLDLTMEPGAPVNDVRGSVGANASLVIVGASSRTARDVQALADDIDTGRIFAPRDGVRPGSIAPPLPVPQVDPNRPPPPPSGGPPRRQSADPMLVRCDEFIDRRTHPISYVLDGQMVKQGEPFRAPVAKVQAQAFAIGLKRRWRQAVIWPVVNGAFQGLTLPAHLWERGSLHLWRASWGVIDSQRGLPQTEPRLPPADGQSDRAPGARTTPGTSRKRRKNRDREIERTSRRIRREQNDDT